MPPITSLGADYRAFAVASGLAHFAIERGVLSDLWSAYERMHDAAAMGPMDWTGKLSPLAFTCSGNPATLTAGDLRLDRLSRVISGITRNVDAEDRFRVWTETDHILRGARRIYIFGLHKQIGHLSDRITQLVGNCSSEGEQTIADLRSEMAQVAREWATQALVCGVAGISNGVA